MQCQSVEINANPLGVGEIEHKGSVEKMVPFVKFLSLLLSLIIATHDPMVLTYADQHFHLIDGQIERECVA